MNVFFLGTGAAEGFPALFSRTPINQEALRRGGKNLRLRSGILLDETIRVDLCPDALAQVHKYPERDLTAIQHLLFTHTHDDHFAARGAPVSLLQLRPRPRGATEYLGKRPGTCEAPV